jgi:membrane protein
LRGSPPLPHDSLHEYLRLGLVRQHATTVASAARRAFDDNITSIAAALAYSAFLAIPSLLLVAVGIFSLVASASAIRTIIGKLETVAPPEAARLLETSLTQIVDKRATTGIALVLVGSVFAIWSLTGFAQTLMWGLNTVYRRDETRGFVEKRLLGLAIVACAFVAFALLVGILILGPKLSVWVGDSIGAETIVRWTWRLGQWPILIAGLLAVFATILRLAPNVEQPRWRILSAGAAGAVLTWLVASAGFAFFVSQFGSYNKTWGSLAAVVITLTWLWLGALALLFGAEIDAERQDA